MESTPEDQKDENTNDTNDLTRTMEDPEPPNKVTQVPPGTPGVGLTSRNSRTALATTDICKFYFVILSNGLKWQCAYQLIKIERGSVFLKLGLVCFLASFRTFANSFI